MTIHLFLLALHISAGSGALAAGLVPLFSSKGSALHRRAGAVYAWTMAGVIGTAAILTVVALKPYFAALTLAAGIACFSGLRVVGRKRPDLHEADRANIVDWLVTIAVLALGLALLLTESRSTQNPVVFRALVFATIAYAGYDLWRFSRPAAFPFFPRLWFYEHLVKMLGSYSAVVAAFSGSILTFLPIPEPWKQLWPTMLFHSLMILLIAKYVRQGRRSAAGRSSSTASASPWCAPPG